MESPLTTLAQPALLSKRFWHPNLIVFISSACIMILEIVAGRIIAPYVGVSLFTWTSVIGVVLAGISVGNYLGGRLADRWASPRFLGSVFVLSGISTLCILAVDRLNQFVNLESLSPSDLSFIIGLVLFIVALFFIPCTILGTISPVVAKLAVHDLTKTGSVVGKIYAAGAAGSIIGTFATGFFLISWFGTHTIVWGVSLVLLTLGLFFFLGGRWKWIIPFALLLVGGVIANLRPMWLRGPCSRETNYYCIRVQEQDMDGKSVRTLLLDRLVHSYSSLDDPTRLVYEYEQLYAEITAYQAQRQKQLRALFIGGGGYTFPRYMEAVYPDSVLHVIEIDPDVTHVAYEVLGLKQDSKIASYNEDARMFLAQEPDDKYDLIMGDAFNDFSVPYHLTTREFNDRVRAWLADDGLYVVNIIDGPWGNFLRAYAQTLRQTFRHVYLAVDIEAWQQSPRQTLVLIAGDTPLDMNVLQGIDAGDSNPQLARQLLTGSELDTLLAEGQRVILTDRYAPVDQLLAPVFLGMAPK